MSEDWQVVEDALIECKGNSLEEWETATAALARLREREAQLERHDSAATQDAVFFRKRMVRLEEALREIVDFGDRQAVLIARRALGEETVHWDKHGNMQRGPAFPLAHEEEK